MCSGWGRIFNSLARVGSRVLGILGVRVNIYFKMGKFGVKFYNQFNKKCNFISG